MASLPTDAQERKNLPIATGVLDYFPDALAEVARVSKIGNDQHNPGEPLHWDRTKSTDESDAAIRHFLEREKKDSDGTYHAAKAIWRMCAFLQKKLEKEREKMPLVKSANKKAVGTNIKREEAAGKPKKQALAIALDVNST